MSWYQSVKMSLLGISFCVLAVFVLAVKGSCPNGWQTYKGNCYFLNTAKKSWIKARAHCSSLGAHLVRVESQGENDFLSKTYMKISKYIWIDGTDAHKEGFWTFSTTSEPIVYKNWSKGNPDNYSSKQHYMALWQSGQWDDGAGSVAAMSICEMDAEVQRNCLCSNFLLEQLISCRKNY